MHSWTIHCQPTSVFTIREITVRTWYNYRHNSILRGFALRSFVLLLAALCCLLPATASSQWVNVQVSNPASTNPEEVVISINPTDPLNLAAGANITYYYYSMDGGYTWTEGNLTSTYGVWGDPCVTFDALGNLYFAHLSWPDQTPDDWLDRIVVQKSTNGGISWSNGVGVGHNPPKDQDKEWITADMTGSIYHNNLYMAWTEFDAIGSSNPADSTRIVFSYSTDHGVSWSEPVRVGDEGGNCLDDDDTVEGAVPAVGPNGEVYLAWSGHNNIYFDKSLDGGVTWGTDIVIATQVAGWNISVPGIYRCNGFPITVCDASGRSNNGRIYVVYSDQPSGPGDTDIFFVQSSDGGATWSLPQQILVESVPAHQFFPWAAVDPVTGYLYVDFYDRRYVGGDTTEVFLAMTDDGGASWSDFRVSDTPFYPVADVFFGDYIGVAALAGKVYPIWTRMDDGDLSVWVALVDIPTGIEVAGTPAGTSIELRQNYPNPFNPVTEICFELPHSSDVDLTVYDVQGRRVRTLVTGTLTAGAKRVTWDGRDVGGNSVSSGVYFYTLRTPSQTISKKMILLK
jgi:hypothetical protein